MAEYEDDLLGDDLTAGGGRGDYGSEEEEIPIEEFEQERDNDNNDDAEEPESVVSSENQARSSSTTSKNALSLTSFSNDPEIKKDAEFLEKFQQIMENSDTSKMFIPYMSQFRATFRKARHSILLSVNHGSKTQLAWKRGISCHQAARSSKQKHRTKTILLLISIFPLVHCSLHFLLNFN